MGAGLRRGAVAADQVLAEHELLRHRFSLSPDGKRAVLVSCLDNLLKGAAGQAVQNMNLMFGFDEKEGLQ